MRQSSKCSGSLLTLTEGQMTQWPARLVLVGAGEDGGSDGAGMARRRPPASSLTLIEPNPSARDRFARGGPGRRAQPSHRDPPEMLVLAVKPQSLDQVAPQIAELAGERTLLLSIIAGKTIANLVARLPHARAVVRAMPNTPAAIGRGVTGAFANAAVEAEQRRWCERLLGAVGAFFWLDDEDAIDAVTAISGSGPAYVFALTEALAAAAERLGLPAELSMGLARGTVEGAAELMRRESATSPATLRRNVTSPGGTTAAALAVLQDAQGSTISWPGDSRGPRPRRGNGGLAGFLGGGRLSAYIARETSTEERAMATRPKSEAKSPPTDARGKIVDALDGACGGDALRGHFDPRHLQGRRRLSGRFPRRLPFQGRGARRLLTPHRPRRPGAGHGELADESPRERLFDVLMRRLEAMAPYREGLREVDRMAAARARRGAWR